MSQHEEYFDCEEISNLQLSDPTFSQFGNEDGRWTTLTMSEKDFDGGNSRTVVRTTFRETKKFDYNVTCVRKATPEEVALGPQTVVVQDKTWYERGTHFKTKFTERVTKITEHKKGRLTATLKKSYALICERMVDCPDPLPVYSYKPLMDYLVQWMKDNDAYTLRIGLALKVLIWKTHLRRFVCSPEQHEVLSLMIQKFSV
jgi:hypothetical protein